MDWRLRVAKLAILARVPFGRGLRRLKRRYLGYEPEPTNLRGTLACLTQMQAALDARNRTFAGSTVLEIGSGWFPTIPIMLTIGGARRVLMTDLNSHMDEVTFAATLRFLKGEFPDDERLREISSLDDLPISYLVQFDPSTIPDGSVDYVISRTVLEHIPPDDLDALFKALRPKLAPSGLMLHLVDHSDHLEHTDKSLSKINFLTWSRRKHTLVNHLTGEGENRLRHHEYPPIFERAGYDVVSATTQVHEPTLHSLRGMRFTPPYSDMTGEQLAALTSLYILAPR